MTLTSVFYINNLTSISGDAGWHRLINPIVHFALVFVWICVNPEAPLSYYRQD